jgi:hypothetical protein
VAEFEGILLEQRGEVIRAEFSCEEFGVVVSVVVDEGGVDGLAITLLDVGKPGRVLECMDPSLARALAAEAARWEASAQLTSPRVFWEPVLEWGVSYWTTDADVARYRGDSDVENFGDDQLAPQLARETAAAVGRPFMKRRAAGPWVLASETDAAVL